MRNSTKIHVPPRRIQPREIPKDPVVPCPELNGPKPKSDWESNVERILQKYEKTIPEAKLEIQKSQPEIPKTQPEVAKSKWSEPEMSHPGRNIVQNVPPVLYNEPIRRTENRLKETKPLPPQTPDQKLIAKDENKTILSSAGIKPHNNLYILNHI